MIVRIWRGETTLDNAAAYEEHLKTSIVPKLEGIAGFLSIDVLRRRKGKGYEYQVQSHWDSMDAIRAFAGGDVEHAVVPAAARAVLRCFDERARHFEVVLEVAKSG